MTAGEWAEQRLDRLRHVQRIHAALALRLADAPGRRPLLGLGRSVRLTDAPAPLGWMFWREPMWRDRVLVPWWLWAVVWIRWHWQLVVFVWVLERLGLWEIEECGYILQDGRPTLPRWIRHAWWCFCNDRDERRPRIVLYISGQAYRRILNEAKQGRSAWIDFARQLEDLERRRLEHVREIIKPLVWIR